MMKNLEVHCYFIILNICLLWVAQGFIFLEGEEAHTDLKSHIEKVDVLALEGSDHKKELQCKHFEHLVLHHGYDGSILKECEAVNMGY